VADTTVVHLLLSGVRLKTVPSRFGLCTSTHPARHTGESRIYITVTPKEARRTCGSLLADLDVRPRVAMQILLRANFKITMEIYTRSPISKTRDALKRLGESLG
jgi:hypothetical protein